MNFLQTGRVGCMARPLSASRAAKNIPPGDSARFMRLKQRCRALPQNSFFLQKIVLTNFHKPPYSIAVKRTGRFPFINLPNRFPRFPIRIGADPDVFQNRKTPESVKSLRGSSYFPGSRTGILRLLRHIRSLSVWRKCGVRYVYTPAQAQSLRAT